MAGWTEDDVLRVLVNPIYCGVSPDYPAMVSEDHWIRTANRLMASGEVTRERFLRTMVEELRSALSFAADRTGA